MKVELALIEHYEIQAKTHVISGVQLCKVSGKRANNKKFYIIIVYYVKAKRPIVVIGPFV